jgi:hypothetical protein
LVDGYQTTKISAIKFVKFSKKSISCLIFFEVTMEDVHFLENSTNLTADILVFW